MAIFHVALEHVMTQFCISHLHTLVNHNEGNTEKENKHVCLTGRPQVFEGAWVCVVSEVANNPIDGEKSGSTSNHPKSYSKGNLERADKHLKVHDKDDAGKNKITLDFNLTQLKIAIRKTWQSIERKIHQGNALDEGVKEPTPKSSLVKKDVFESRPVQVRVCQESLLVVLPVKYRKPNNWDSCEHYVVARVK